MDGFESVLNGARLILVETLPRVLLQILVKMLFDAPAGGRDRTDVYLLRVTLSSLEGFPQIHRGGKADDIGLHMVPK